MTMVPLGYSVTWWGLLSSLSLMWKWFLPWASLVGTEKRACESIALRPMLGSHISTFMLRRVHAFEGLVITCSFCRMQPSFAYLEKPEIWDTAPSLGFSLSPNGYHLLFFWPARSGYYGTELCTHDSYILWPKDMNCFHHTLSVEVSLLFFLF